jgi:hypothetical protein
MSISSCLRAPWSLPTLSTARHSGLHLLRCRSYKKIPSPGMLTLFPEVVSLTPLHRRQSDAFHNRFDITPNGQQVHVAFGPNLEPKSRRHPCFKVESEAALRKLQTQIWEHHVKGDKAAPLEADQPGEVNSGMLASFCERFVG